MADVYKKLYQGQPGASPTTLYTVPAGKAALIKRIVATNPTGTDRTLTLWHDGTANANVILPPATILAGGWGEDDGLYVLEAGDTISGQASAASAITVTIYGLETPA